LPSAAFPYSIKGTTEVITIAIITIAIMIADILCFFFEFIITSLLHPESQAFLILYSEMVLLLCKKVTFLF